MKSASVLGIFLLFCVLTAGASPMAERPNKDEFELELEYDELSIGRRMESMINNMIKPRRNPVSMGYIRNYMTRSRRSTELIIGRSTLYFSLFEQYLKRHQLPEELKYLPVVESALNPKAVSRAGAAGLWQFMPGTGKLEGLITNKYIDERFDPVKSTEAAMRHLKRLYQMFGDWELVLAAYNSGSGTVARAIKRARSEDYWKIQRYLPRETRNYVPAFIAASYICEHFELHGISPNLPELDMQLTDRIKVYHGFSFFEIATLTGLSVEAIEALNPAYSEGYIPEGNQGYYLTLPRRVLPAVLDYMAAKLPDNSDPEPLFAGPVALFGFPMAETYYQEHTYAIEEEDLSLTLDQLASRLQVSRFHLRVWNPANIGRVALGQSWKYYGPKAYRRLVKEKKTFVDNTVATLPMPEMKAVAYDNPPIQGPLKSTPGERYLVVRVNKAESLPNIARRYEGVSADDLRRLNRVMGNPTFRAGQIVKIKEL
jgi:membrane-bound lytic murein transglycosylase D